MTAVVLLAACADPGRKASLLPLLDERPKRPHEVIAVLDARGNTGAPVQYVYDELRRKAKALGADAVVKTAQHSVWDAAPAPHEPRDRPLLGNPYPGPLHALEPGAFPPQGNDVKVRGRYYVVEGLAIRYVD